MKIKILSLFNFVKKRDKPLLFLWLSIIPTINSYSQTVISLYKEIPNSKTALNYNENADTGSNGIIWIRRVSIPEITIFQPEKSKEKNAVVIICPGGAYGALAYNLEGTEAAKFLNSWGVVAIVLKYRLPNDAIMKDKSMGPLQDAQRALQYVRENAQRFNINPRKIGIMGFSAGGHLASSASVHFNKAYIDNPKNTSLRPDFSILAYPVISFTDSLTHLGSRNNLIGKNTSEELIKKFSNELQVTKNTPPTFLVLAGDDDIVNPENSIKYFEALLKNRVAAEMYIFQNGGHGFGTNNRTTKVNWMETLKNWMERNNFL